MSKNPVYGFEKPYFENIKKEISVYVNEAYYDEFGNLIFIKNGSDSSKTVLVAAYASENAFLVTDISESGLIKSVPLIAPEETIINQKVLIGSKSGYITKKDNNYFVDFGVSDKKTAEKIAKCGDTFYIKPEFEILGNYYFTNEKAFALKNIISSLIKNEYTYKTVFVLLKEKAKGAFALGKNLKSDNAFFLTLTEETKEEISYLKKEKSYISDFKTNKIPAFISENTLSYADSYYLAGGCPNVAGIAVKCEKLDNGTFKFPKNSVKKLTDFLEQL